MQQMPTNAPIVESKPGPAGWLSVWSRAVTQPSENTFIEITEHPFAQSKTAFLWIFLAGTLSVLVSGLIQAILLAAGVQAQAIPGLEQFSGSGTGLVGGSLVSVLCGAPIAGIISVVLFAIGVAIIQWIAKMFGGTGTFEKLAYGVAAISVPVSLVTMLLTPFSMVPYLNICTGLLSFGIGLYALYLEILAVKAINRFGWGAAIGSVLILPLTLFLCCCVVIGALALSGPAIGEIFSEINRSLQTAP